MKIAFETLGCKLNQAETESLARQFVENGYELVSSRDVADVYILNTCTVTRTADAKSRHLLRLAHRKYPNAVIIVTGCYAERAALELKDIEGVNFIVGNNEKTNLLEIIQKIPLKENLEKAPSGQPSAFRTRAFIKIQDGCRNFCAYCIVPFVRSQEVSLPPDAIVGEVLQRVAEGYQEVVLTGTRVGGYDSSGVDLRGLLERILSETNIARIRLSSLQPQELSRGLIKLWQNNRLCPHFHLSLQSGSSGVLKRMKRHYTPGEYQQAVNLIRAEVPAVAITTDIIVGFPGETEQEFEESLEFCRRIGFARIHVFQYSPRSGTEAAKMTGQVTDKIKKERSLKMLALAEESARKFREHFAGELMDVLWEKQTDDGEWSGITGNYLRVFTKSNQKLGNRLIKTTLK